MILIQYFLEKNAINDSNSVAALRMIILLGRSVIIKL